MKKGRQYDLYNSLNTFSFREDLTAKHAKLIRDAVLYVCEHSPYTLYDSVFEWKRIKDINGNKVGEENYLTGIPTTNGEKKEIDEMIKKYFSDNNIEAELKYENGRYRVNIYYEEEA